MRLSKRRDLKSATVKLDAKLLEQLLEAAASGVKVDVDTLLNQQRLTLDPNLVDKKWLTTFHTCPQCKFHGDIATYFGIRKVRGVEHMQSWCADCRSKINYHKLERKNEMERYHQRAGNVHENLRVNEEAPDEPGTITVDDLAALIKKLRKGKH